MTADHLLSASSQPFSIGVAPVGTPNCAKRFLPVLNNPLVLFGADDEVLGAHLEVQVPSAVSMRHKKPLLTGMNAGLHACRADPDNDVIGLIINSRHVDGTHLYYNDKLPASMQTFWDRFCIQLLVLMNFCIEKASSLNCLVQQEKGACGRH